MATLFGRSKKHRSRTTSEGSDTLDGNSIPYNATSAPAARPVPRQSVSGVGHHPSSDPSRSSLLSASSSQQRPLSPTLKTFNGRPITGKDISIPINLIPGNMPYEGSSGIGTIEEAGSSSSPSDIASGSGVAREYYSQYGQQQQQLYQNNHRQHSYTTDGGRGTGTAADTNHPSSSSRHPATSTPSTSSTNKRIDRKKPPSVTSSTSTSNSGPGGQASAPVPVPKDFGVRSNSRAGDYFDAGQSSTTSSRGSDAVSSVQSLRESTSSSRPPYSPSIRQSNFSNTAQYPQYPYQQSSSTLHPAHSPNPNASSSSQTSIRASISSEHSVSSKPSTSSLRTTTAATSLAPPLTPSMTSNEFYFPRPQNDRDIEYLFEDLLERTDVPYATREQMANFPVAKKWVMVYNDKLQEWQQARKARQGHRNSSVVGSSTPMLGSSAPASISPILEQGPVEQLPVNTGYKVAQRAKTETPEWYLTKFMDRSIQPATISSLTVGLRTYEIGWVKSFLELQGLSVLTNALANITRLPQPLKEHDLKVELELAKCLKTLLNIKVGVLPVHR